MRNIKNEKGIGLVEVILALGISVIVVTSLVSLSIYTVRSNLTAKLLLEGTKLANEQLEDVRAFREIMLASGDWASFVNALTSKNCSTAPCYIDFATVSGVIDANVVHSGAQTVNGATPAEIVTRSFQISDPINIGSTVDPSVDNVIRVSVSATWKIGSAPDKFSRVYTDLSNWR